MPPPVRHAHPLHWLRFALAILFGMMAPLAAAHAEEKRIALVIGNSDYENIGKLSNPRNDALLIRQTLESLNFEVIYRENARKEDMERAISAFGQKLYAAGPSAVGLFYYAGHGVQSSGENFLLPVDVELMRETDLRFGGVRVSDMMAQMDASGVGTKIVILDACRDNPFYTRFGRNKAGSGLAEIGLGSSEFFVAYAATSGNVADDGNGKNSPYAMALARRLPTMTSEISNTFRLVRVDVSAATGQKQLPEARTTLRREFYFAGEPANRPAEQLAMLDTQAVETKVPSVADIVGRWCTAGRSTGTSFEISGDELRYFLGGQNASYKIKNITQQDDKKLSLVWINRNGPVTFEFGQFSTSGKMMTQIRGRQGDNGDWKDYNLRLRRCD